MAASKFTRNKDYSDDANNNAGGRDSVDCAGLDGEMDEIVTVTDDHADKLDLLLRGDLLMQDSVLQGHEFSALAVTVLKALLGVAGALNWRGDWVTATDYAAGDIYLDQGVSNNAYIVLVDHTSGADVLTDIGLGNVELFIPGGSSALPASPSSDDVVYYNGASAAWGKITAAMAPLHALLASPTFTGVVTLPTINHTGPFKASVQTVTFSAAATVLDFGTSWLKRMDVSGDFTAAITAGSIQQGRFIEFHMTNTKGSDAALLWDSNWVWMGYAPSILPSGKKAILTIRAITGATAADIVAAWSVQP